MRIKKMSEVKSNGKKREKRERKGGKCRAEQDVSEEKRRKNVDYERKGKVTKGRAMKGRKEW